MEPVVTVGIPCFNNERTLRRAIDSVRAQTRDDWVLHMSDDDSGDATWSICEEAARADPRIFVHRQPARRMYMNFGDLLAEARTPYFAWLAADDYWSPGYMAHCIAALEAAPDAVSALPRCSITLADAAPRIPNTETLDGDRSARLRRYLEAPGGTRMYGLARTEPLRTSFPKRNMNGYDWYMMVGLLGTGAQIEVPHVLLHREQTHWMRYVEVVDELYSSPLLRQFPVLDMSLAAIRAGRVPLDILWPLLRLNGRKHAEYLAVMRPKQFARRLPLFRRLGMHIARPDVTAGVADSVLRRSEPARASAAHDILLAETGRGNPWAGIALGHARRDGVVSGDPLEAYEEAARTGCPDAIYHAARFRLERDHEPQEAIWPRLIGAAHRGSRPARAFLRERAAEGALPDAVARVVARALPGGRPTRPAGGAG